ncbi:MAG: hypothetical protein K5840_02100 [Eubacterium sp.]|nr:hypothetical protein [Eubacterium sp.]
MRWLLCRFCFWRMWQAWRADRDSSAEHVSGMDGVYGAAGARCAEVLSRASFTVEASVLIPLVFGVTMFFCGIALWFYDEGIAWMNMDDVAEYASYVTDPDSGAEGAEGLAVDYSAAISQAFYLSDVYAPDSYSGSRYMVKASCEGRATIPAGDWFRALGWPSFGKLGADVSRPVYRHTEVIRAYRLVDSE